jgi:hypothetical protein
MAAQPAWQYPFAIDSIADANLGLPLYLVFMPKNKLEISLTQELLSKLKQLPEPFMILVVCLVLMCSLSVCLVTNTTSDQDQNVTPVVLNAAENWALVLRELGKHYFTY